MKKVWRIVQIEGPDEWVDQSVANGYVHGVVTLSEAKSMTEIANVSDIAIIQRLTEVLAGVGVGEREATSDHG